MSADSDFSPVLLRLRRFDRRLMVITPSDASRAYTQIADTVIESDDFVAQALEAHDPEGHPDVYDQHRLRQLAERLEDAIVKNGGSIPGHSVHLVFKNESDFGESNWYGFYSLSALVDALVRQNQRLEVVSTSDESWSVQVGNLTLPYSKSASIVREVDDFIRSEVSSSSRPMPGASLAHTLQHRYPNSIWFGFASFGSFITDCAGRLGLDYTRAGGHDVIWDPERHEPPAPPHESNTNHLVDAENTELYEFVQRLNRNYNIPPLRSEVYNRIFEIILEAVSSQGFFDLNTTSKKVRDRIVEDGYPVSRKWIQFIVRGLLSQGLNWEEEQNLKSFDLSAHFRSNIFKLVDTSHLRLNQEERLMVENWIGPKT